MSDVPLHESDTPSDAFPVRNSTLDFSEGDFFVQTTTYFMPQDENLTPEETGVPPDEESEDHAAAADLARRYEEIYMAASPIMHRGMDLVALNQPEGLAEALECFDTAISMRSTLPINTNSWYRYGLIAGWLNRGEALLRLGGPTVHGGDSDSTDTSARTSFHLAEAVKAFDTGLDLLRDLPLAENPLYPRRLAIAWINRGFALQGMLHPGSGGAGGDTQTAEAAAESFRNAIAALSLPEAAAIEDLIPLRIGALLNLAGAVLQQIPAAASSSSVVAYPYPSDAAATPQVLALATEARDIARKALVLSAPLETERLDIAEASLKTRHVLCRALAHGISASDSTSRPAGARGAAGRTDATDATDAGNSATPTQGWMAEATDVVDDGMALARHWEQRGHTGLRPLSQDVFRFGCRIYAAHLPHFLAEFVLENLDVKQDTGTLPFTPAVHNAALIAVWSAWHEIERAGYKSINTPRFEQLLADLRELRVTEDRLEDMRRQATQAGLIAAPRGL